MAFVILDSGFLRLSVRYLEKLKSGTYRYYRRIPEALRRHHQGKRFLRENLRTKNPLIAAKKAQALAAQHDALWESIRSPEGQSLGLTTRKYREAAVALLNSLNLSPGEAHGSLDAAFAPVSVLDEHFGKKYGHAYEAARNDPNNDTGDLGGVLDPVELEAVRLLRESPNKRRVLLSDALEVYLEEHRGGSQPKFSRDTRRALGHVFSVVGDWPLQSYEREHARQVRDHLLAQGVRTGTVRRELTRIVAVFNKGNLELGRQEAFNPFAELAIADEEKDAKKRVPFTCNELKAIAKACRDRDDDIRHLVAMHLDTGARISEVVGLRVEDVSLDGDIPYIHFRFHEALGRTLKNQESVRKVPLVGMALWGAQRAMNNATKAKEHGGWLFARYAKDNNIKATHASNTVNKWLRKSLKIDKTSHSFRHTMKDRLRDAEAPEHLQNEIGGWGTRTEAQSYGEGYTLRLLKGHLDKVVLD